MVTANPHTPLPVEQEAATAPGQRATCRLHTLCCSMGQRDSGRGAAALGAARGLQQLLR